MDIEGKTALVTGGASGIGAGIVRALVDRGARVAIADFDGAGAQALAAEIGGDAKSYQFDAADSASVEAMAETAWEELGGVDLVFANAGISKGAPLLDATDEEFDWHFKVNVRGVWATGRAFFKRMLAEGRKGHLTITASEHGLGFLHAGAGFYTGTKHAILGMADVWRNELPDTLSISVLCPGLVATKLYDPGRFGEMPPTPEPVKAFGAAVMERGMDPKDAGVLAVEGTERGDFLIVTHPFAFDSAKQRFEDIKAAFEAQASKLEEARQYDVVSVIAAVQQEMGAG